MTAVEESLGLGSRLSMSRNGTPLTSIPQVMEQSARLYGRRTAFQEKVGSEFQTVSYEELLRRAADFGAGLLAMGLRHGDRVGIISENCIDWVVAFLGQSMAGGVAVPLYIEMKGSEVQPRLEQADARFVVASEKVLPNLVDHMGRAEKVIVIGRRDPATDGRVKVRGGLFGRAHHAELLLFEAVTERATPDSRLALAGVRIEPDELATLIYTSGTTGGMKAVMQTHRNILSNVESVRGALNFDDRDSLLLVLPLHHSFPLTVGVVTTLMAGALVTFENDLLRTRDRMLETRPTAFVGIPTLYDLMLRAIRGRVQSEGRMKTFERGLRLVDTVKRRTGVNLGPRVFSQLQQNLGGRLRFLFSGAAPLSPRTQREYFRLGLPLLQGWGLTEASPVVTAQRYVPRRFIFSNYYEERIGSVGMPIPNVEVKLIDAPEKETFVQLHGEGELIVRGENVTPGYWKSPQATERIKLGDWLRTGDLGRIDDEGNVYITGRSKYVIVLESGEKVHPDEVEDLLAESPLFEDVAVLGKKVRDKTQVWAVIYPRYADIQTRLDANGAVEESKLRELIEEEIGRFGKQMAPYKRISHILLSDQPLPKTALRKVSREHLKEEYGFDVKRWMDASGADG